MTNQKKPRKYWKEKHGAYYLIISSVDLLRYKVELKTKSEKEFIRTWNKIIKNS